MLGAFIALLAVQSAFASKIIGGQVAPPEKFPFIVHLDSGSVQAYCDGSIFNDLWILSAAHCRQNGKADRYTVVAGDFSLMSDSNDNEQSIVMAEMIAHADYNSGTLENDIMLIKLAKALVWTASVSPILLPTKSPTPDELCDISGWGNTNTVDTTWPDELQYVTLPVINTAECNSALAYNGEILPGMVCIGTMAGGQDSCQGDSGGPATVAGNNTQVGIVSWGYGCAQRTKPGVYTDVFAYVEWIHTTAS